MRKTLSLLVIVVTKSLKVEQALAPWVQFSADLSRPEIITDPGKHKHDVTEEIIGPNAPWRLPVSPWLTMDSIAPPRAETIDLDLHPYERWKVVMEKYRDEILPYFDQWQTILQKHPEINPDIWVKTFEDRASHVYLDELRGIFDTLNKNLDASNVTWNNLVLFQMQYELGSPMACSQILAATPDGTVLHGRNLDYRVVSPMLELTFIRHGKPIVVGATFLGGIGLHTGFRPGNWSFGTNTRHLESDNAEDNLARALRGGWTYAMLLRKLSEKDLSFNELVAKLRSTPMIRGSYVLVAGPGPYQGINIVRSPSPKFRYVEELSPVGKWFIVQTNDDNFMPPKDGRREGGINAMKSMTQMKLEPTALMNIMHAPPLLVPANIVLFISSPKSGRYCTILGKKAGSSDVVCPMEGWTNALPGVESLWVDWFQYKM